MQHYLTRMVAFLLLLTSYVNAQVYDPVEWKFSVEMTAPDEADLIVEATIEDHWHLYSQFLPRDDGPIATSFFFDDSDNFERIGKVKESKSITEYDKVNEMELTFFEKKAVFTQHIKILKDKPFEVSGYLEFMVCDDEKCLPPESVDFEFPRLLPNRTSEKEVHREADIEKKKTTDVKMGDKNSFGETMVSPVGGDTEGDVPEIFDPVSWKHELNNLGGGNYEVILIAKIEKGWHLYSQKLSSDEGPLPTSINFQQAESEIYDGQVEERGDLISEYDPNFMMELDYYEGEVSFVQKVTVEGDAVIKGALEFMVCNDKMCLPPELLDFEVRIPSGDGFVGVADVYTKDADVDLGKIIPYLPGVNLEAPLGECGEKREISNIWLVFLFGFIGGLIALLTPCVFPMIPLTVSFFTKGDGKGAGGLMKASLYGLFILLIYLSLSIPFHFNTDPEVLNEVATSVWLNLIFFLVFVVFAISFFGYFEITLPSSIANKADSASNVGGVIGIFFMALTLALVSFSCTGPILGTVLGNSLKNGPWPISAAMGGFGLALGLPFAFFAAFPGYMNKLPRSGGWLNSVKVVLGFVELALALKFLSNADLVEQWGFIKRETFFLIWSIISIGLGLYLLGWIKFPHDSPVKKYSKVRISLIALIIGFSVYIIPGIFKNPPWNHNLLSGFPPPTFYSWYDNETFHAEYMDFNEAYAEAQRTNKPLLIDFTGWACVNCRKMEESVWTVEEIKEILREDFILVSLYVDDKVELPEELQGVFEFEANGKTKKKRIRTIGNKWATFQTHTFNNNSQPYYVMLNTKGELLGNPVGYTPDVDEYREYLECGLNAFKGSEEVVLGN